jgi:hypothetical protein
MFRHVLKADLSVVEMYNIECLYNARIPKFFNN